MRPQGGVIFPRQEWENACSSSSLSLFCLLAFRLGPCERPRMGERMFIELTYFFKSFCQSVHTEQENLTDECFSNTNSMRPLVFATVD